MSKKSRRRNKKILAAIGIGLGAAALASKRRKDATADVDSGRGGDSASAEARTNANKKTDYITKKDTSKSEAKPIVAEPKKIVNTSRSRMMRPNPKADGESMGPKETATFNAKNKMPDTAPPSIDNPYSSRVIKGRIGMGRNMKSGGRS
jgi:hypothetical protein